MSLTVSGRIHLIMGCMFSGKTTELFRCFRRLAAAKIKCQMIKYEQDVRYSVESAATHDQQMILCRRGKVLMPLLDDTDFVTNCDALFIDEAQFYPDIVTFADKWANLGKELYIALLDGTFERKPFGQVLELIPLSFSCIKLTAVCHVCQVNEAPFTHRLGSEKETKVIGGQDKYQAVCRGCYTRLNLAKALSDTSDTSMTTVIQDHQETTTSASTTTIQTSVQAKLAVQDQDAYTFVT